MRVRGEAGLTAFGLTGGVTLRFLRGVVFGLSLFSVCFGFAFVLGFGSGDLSEEISGDSSACFSFSLIFL